jgi:transcriptional regulator with XRE-family HTH domain
MTAQPQSRDDTTQALRKEAGTWLRGLREAAGLSQRDLSDKVGFDYYTFISQIEAGRGKVPPERYEAYAKALGVAPRDFVKTLLRYYNPLTFDILFGGAEEPAPVAEPEGFVTARALDDRLKGIEQFIAKFSK